MKPQQLLLAVIGVAALVGFPLVIHNEKRLSDAAPKLVKRGDAGGGR